jgi:hypothetical protein
MAMQNRNPAPRGVTSKTPAGEQLGVVFKTGPLMCAGRERFESVRVPGGSYRHMVDPSGDGSACPAGRLEETAGKERD